MPTPTETGSPLRELSITRYIAAPPSRVWEVFTTRTSEWWCPKPWTTPVVDWDLRPGGSARAIMQSPDGQQQEHDGVFLEVIPERRAVFTDAFRGDWIPDGPFMLSILELAPEGEGTRYTARVRHWTDEALQQHIAMGFEAGWGAVADQLAELAEGEERI